MLKSTPPAPASLPLGRIELSPPPRPASGISFDRPNGESVKFSEPSRLGPISSIGRLRAPGLYVILKNDGSASPRPFRELYFGESENIHERASNSHERFEDWSSAAGGESNLYVAYHWMFGSSKEERTSVEADLIERYHPQCNIAQNPFASFLAEYARPASGPGAPTLDPAARSLFGVSRVLGSK
jgi:hypothetical protein